jgi:CheY-like chemotaxis protein
MPRMSGLDVLRKLTDDPTLKYIPVVVISGKAYRDELPTDFRLRISSFFSKPFDINALLSAIESLLG